MLITHGDKITAAQAAQLCKRSIATIRQWGHRGVVLPNGERFHLRPIGTDENGHNLFAITDVAVIDNALRQRAARAA